MNSFDHQSCFEDTRFELLNHIADWLLSDTKQNILWLHGVAGSGKSTIATTVAEFCGNISRLGAHLFFSRVNGAEDQLASIFRTIAFQLACFDSSIARCIESAVQKSEYVTNSRAEVQFRELLMAPLTDARDKVHGPIVIIIDALDECGTPTARRSLMKILKGEFGKLPPNFRFVITSRPEDDITTALSNRPNSVYEISLGSVSADSRRDVLRYIDYEMSRIVNETQIVVPDDWLWSKQMERLADASEGLFIWASTAINLVSESTSKFRKLKELVNASNRLKGLDQLYESVLRNSGVIAMDDPSSIVRFQQVLGLALLSRVPLSDIIIDALLGLPPEEPSYEILSKLGSVLVFRRGESVRLLHTSFADYLLSTHCSQPCSKHGNSFECLSDPWFIDKASQQSAIALRCFIVMKDMLHFNMCNLESSFIYNKNVTRIEDRINETSPAHLQYACAYWAQHLVDASYSHKLLDELISFAHKRLLYWFEVIGLLGLVHSIANRALLDGAAWSEKHDSDVSLFLKDASKLASAFATPMAECTPHIYVSMLPLMKDDSKVAAHYSKQTSANVEVDRIGTKRPSLWLKVLDGHSDRIQSVSFSPDGKRVVSGSGDGTARIWGVESGEVLCEFFEENGAYVTSVTFSPDGQRIVSGSWGGTVTIWDIESRAVISGPFEGHTAGVYAVAFSRDGTHVASASADTTIRVWDVKSGFAVHVLEGHTAGICSIAFFSDGKRIVSGSRDMTIRIWDTETEQAICEPFAGHTDEVWSVAISPDGRRIVSASRDRTVRIWDVDSGRVVTDPFQHSNTVFAVAFSSDGTRIVSGAADNTIVVWDAESDIVYSVAFSPDRSRIVSGSHDKTVRLWDASIGKVVSSTSVRHTTAVTSVAFSLDGSRIASGSYDKTVRLWDANVVFSVAFSPDGKRIISGSWDKCVIIWDVQDSKMVFTPLQGHTDSVTSVAFSPDGTRVVSGSDDKTIIIWNAESGDKVAQSEQVHTTEIFTVAFSPDGMLIASASHNNDVVIWNAESGKCVSRPFKAPQDSTSTFPNFAPLAFSPDERCIASRSSDDDIIIRDVHSGKIIFGPLKGHSNTVTSAAFSPASAYLVSGSFDRTIIVWDVNNGDMLSEPYQGHAGPVTCVALSPDGLHTVSCSLDATIRIWAVPGKETVSSITGELPYNAVTSSSSIEDINEGFTSWTLSSDGWVLGVQDELLLWLPPDIRPTLWRPQNTAVFSCDFSTKLNFKNVAYGLHWQECFNPNV
ncbi:WD40 repeat-like protein [Fomitiporia mediterranea MF3/22]|uniref:WD40 repeat-like protein n=1 Tax=Fomitiporia mediterranea (strain MF3/22) TaxID=694068 RepID=UPI00044083B1|nr:WD40 repeat-like protein [Fomitiporia mediterranea MF3/22]EJC99716.1 WD40 repeat-like protein [Fomitiporia mediterranea MF3/22]